MSVFYWLLGLDEARSVRGTSHWAWRVLSPVSPVWLIVLAVVGLICVVATLFLRSGATTRLRLSLAGLRLVGFLILILMAAQIELELLVTRERAPTLVVMTDTSASMSLHDAGDRTRLEAARKTLADLRAQIGGRARISPYEFDWNVRHLDDAPPPASTRPATSPARQPASDGQTRLIRSIADVAAREPDARMIVLLSDGNDTAGDTGGLLAPLLAARRLPVYPVVIGDPQAKGHAALRASAPGVAVRLGDEFRLSATLSANGLPEQTVAVRVYEAGRDVAIATRENVRLGENPIDLSFTIKPEKVGKRIYRVVAEGVKGATTDRSLTVEREVEVVNSRIKVLYVDIPRDERKLLGHWLARDPVVDLSTLTMMPKGGWYGQGPLQHKNVGEGLPGDEADLFKYDVVILGDIPRGYFRAGGDTSETKLQRLVEFVARRGGGLVTLGGRSVYSAGQYQDSPLARVLPFGIDTTEDPQIAKPFKLTLTPAGLAHPMMSLETEPAMNREAWDDMPALDGSNRVGAARAGATVLATRHTDAGPVPMIAIQSVGKGQVLSLAVDTTWRWQMMRPAESEDHYRRFWGNAVRALAPDPRVSPNLPQVTRYRSNPAVGETITLATRLVDGSYRPIRGGDVSVLVQSPTGRATMIYPRDGRQRPGVYEYDIALDEPGAWTVATTFQGKTATETIIAGDSANELDDPRARPEAMEKLAEATGGKVCADAVQLLGGLDLKPQAEARPATVAIWNLPVMLIAFIAVVCVDCFVRKRRGMP